MATTTFEAIRDAMITQLQAETPTSFAAVPFKATLAERDLLEWAEANPEACFRRFDIVDNFGDEPPAAGNLDVQEVAKNVSILVSYPNDRRYGGDNSRDMRDIIREDNRVVMKAIGPEGGFRSFADAAILEPIQSIQESDAVVIHSTDIQVIYYRSMP